MNNKGNDILLYSLINPKLSAKNTEILNKVKLNEHLLAALIVPKYCTIHRLLPSTCLFCSFYFADKLKIGNIFCWQTRTLPSKNQAGIFNCGHNE